PLNLWTYKRLPMRPFPESVISNALDISSLQVDKIPEPSTNDYFIWTKLNGCGTGFEIFGIQPAKATIYYGATNQSLSTDEMPGNQTVKERAYYYASLLGLENAHLIPQNIFYSATASGIDGKSTDGFCGKEIFLSRELDGVTFYGSGND